MWLLGLEIAILLLGSVVMAKNVSVSGAMSGWIPLSIWLTRGPFALTWWMWTAIFLLALLAINTVCCSTESVRRKKGGLLPLLAPQIIHIGFLLILIAHLVSSLGASKLTGQLPEGALARLPSGLDLFLDKVETGARPNAEVELLSRGNVLKRGVLAPNHPVFFRGYGFYLQDLKMDPFPAAFIEVSREPGAPWALFGAILFTAGTILLVLLKSKQE
ncbi:MAG: hypothetical protein M0Z48_06170 [Nitrospiraceae bacterium]|nr:hypothetical protein [Nitrospiraceae bacterium]